MAALLLVDGVSWGKQMQAGASAFLSSLQRSDVPLGPCSCECHNGPSTSATTTRCAASSSLFEMLDPSLPHFPTHQQSMTASEVSRYRLITLENRSKLNLLYVDESSTRSKEPSLDETWNNLEQPSFPENRDTSKNVPSFTDGQAGDIRSRQRLSPSYMSISRSRRAMSNGGTSQMVQTPFRSKDLKGPSGFYVGFAAIMLGLAAVLQKGGLLGTNSPHTTLCSNCDGYGKKVCNLCKGRGSVTWEGKLTHTDLCPSCFGARVRKCRDCGGHCARNDEPPFLRQVTKLKSSKARP